MKKKSMLAALIMVSLLHGSVYAAEPGEVNGAWSFNGVEEVTDGYTNKVDGTYNEYDGVYGNGSLSTTGDINGGTLTIVDDAGNSMYAGVIGLNANVSNGKVNVYGDNDGSLGDVYGAFSYGYDDTENKITENEVYVYKGTISNLYGAYAESEVVVSNKIVTGNKIYIYGDNTNKIEIEQAVAGFAAFGDVNNNTMEINGTNQEIDNVYGGLVSFGNASNNNVNIIDGTVNREIYGGYSYLGSVKNNIVNVTKISGTSEDDAEFGLVIYGGKADSYYESGIPLDVSDLTVSGNEVTIESGTIRMVYAGAAEFNGHADDKDNPVCASVIGNKVTVKGDAEIYEMLVGGQTSVKEASENIVEVEGNAHVANVYGGVSLGSDAKDNVVNLSGKSTIEGKVVAGLSNESTAELSGNTINLFEKANVEKADLFGYQMATSNTHDNNLVIDKGWTGKANSVQNFNNINFNNIVWQPDNDKAILTTDKGSIKDTNINLTLQNGQKVNVGESMLLFESNNDLGYIANDGNTFNTTLGVATAVEGIVEQSADNKTVTATIKDVKLADQTKLVAKNRAVAAAFVNQGTDLIADSLDTLSRDGKYGVKTFAAVHGNRSKYDINSDIKINGWSTIVGVGSETEHNGGDFSWGVFYENGSGNYRTFNSFNNEFFRADGSLVYNGGGIAARYENAHGVYTEGSLRAGMLKSDMDNALSDGENKYGYSSESEYYGAHIGIGQIIPLSESSDLDVYGKFFHTYTEGDSFKVDTDEFEFDSINSDRLRVGARLTTNKENKFSTYYGLAYEYEFNGDAEMRAAGMNAPTQSLQGSSCMAEIGFNYQPTPDSPWSFDLNMRGYAGEREGATFNVQATYTF